MTKDALTFKLDTSALDRALLKKIAGMPSAKRQILGSVGIQGAKGMRENFLVRQADETGSRWRPLSQKTLESRARSKRGRRAGLPKILVDTGFMSDIRHEVRSDHVKVGTMANYGSKHQFGQGLPARKWAYFAEATQRKIKEAMSLVFRKVFR
jgi:phage virion morphogenesis protein